MPRSSGLRGSRKRWAAKPEHWLTDSAEATTAGLCGAAADASQAMAAPSAEAGPAKRCRYSERSQALAALEQKGKHDWDRLSFELQCRLLSCLGAVDVVKMALVSRRWNAAVLLHLQVRVVLSFSEGPRGVVPRGLSDAVLYSLLGRCPRLRCIYGFHFPRLLQQELEHDGSGGSSSQIMNPVVMKAGRLTTAGVTRSLRRCPQLEGIEISDPALLQAVPEALPKVQLLYGFRNRHGHLPMGELSSLRLPPDVFTTSVELYAITMPQLPSLRHVKRLHLQYVLFTRPQPFEGCSLPELESFAMKFCTAPELDRNVHLIDLHGVHMELHGYRPLFEALASAPALHSLELVAVPFPGGMLQQLVTTRRSAGGGFTNLRRIVFGNCSNAVEDDLGVLVVSSGSRLEQLSVQQGLSRDSLLRALSVCRCVLPALTHLRLGHSEQRSAALGTQDTRDRRRRPIPFDIERDRTRSPCLLTDGGLTRTLASPMLPRLSVLSINESPHLIDVRTWTAPVKAQLTELTLSRCHSLRLDELEEAIERMTSLRHLRLEHVFREPPKGCWHVGLTAGTGLGASAGPFGMTVGRTGARGTARQQAAASSANRSEGVTTTTSSPTVETHAGAGSYRPCTCTRRAHDRYVTCQAVRYRAAQVHASTQVSSDELRCGGSAAASGQQQQQHHGSASSETSACGLCPRCDGVWHSRAGQARAGQAPPPQRASRSRPGRGRNGSRRAAAAAAAACFAAALVREGGESSGQRHGQRQPPPARPRPGGGATVGRAWNGDGDDDTDSSSSSSTGSSSSSGSITTSGTDDWEPDDWEREADHCPRVASKGTGTSDPLPEPDTDTPLRVHSSSLVSLSLDHVGVTGIVVEACPRLDNVSAYSCRALVRFAVEDTGLAHGAPLSRVTIFDCPKLDAASVVHWSVKQPLPPESSGSDPSEPSLSSRFSCAALRMRVLESNWSAAGWQQRRIPGLDGFAGSSQQSPVADTATDDDDAAAYVIVEEHGPWSDARRRLHLEGALCALLTPRWKPSYDTSSCGSRSAPSVASAPSEDDAATAAAAHRPRKPQAQHRRQCRRRRQRWGHAKVMAPVPPCATDEDELSRDGLVDGAIRARFVHNLWPCLVCGRQIDLWGAENCSSRKQKKVCICKPPTVPASLRVLTCTYLYMPQCSSTCDCDY